MKTKNILLILSQALFLLATAAYDIRCIWPEKFGQDPFDSLHHDGFFGMFMVENKVETPVVIRLTQHGTMCRAMCLSLHDPDVLDPYNKEPTWTVPPFGQNAFSTVMCIGQCMLYVSEGFLDYNEQAVAYFEDNYDLMYTFPSTRPDIEDAWEAYRMEGNESPMIDIMQNDEVPYNPYLMGHIAGYYVKYYQNMDGWNAMGEMNWDRETKMEVPCTGSCRPYQNTVGYEPVVDPRIHSMVDMDGSKYNCTGNCRKWQPLQEGNDGGSLKRQEFITPHIGEKAMRFLHQDKSIVLTDPMYDLYEDSLQVIEEVKMTQGNKYREDAVAFFDDKLKVRGLIRNEVRREYAKKRKVHSFQDDLINLIGMATAEYDAIIIAWHEKKHHDLVRPTTVIKHWGDDIVMTGEEGPIKARDFEASIRVMPHAEFPSGSSCLCTAYYEYTDILTTAWYNDTITDFTWKKYPVANLEELRDTCGASRLWGGMHYPEAIEGGNVACSGLGQLAFDYTMELKNGATFDNAYYWGDGLGACPARA